VATNVKPEDALQRAAQTGLTIRELFPYECDVAYIQGSGTLRRRIGERLRAGADGEYVMRFNTRPDSENHENVWVDTYHFSEPSTAMFLKLCYGSGVFEGVQDLEDFPSEEVEKLSENYEVEWNGKVYGFRHEDF
jgi:hypothetical protein